MKMKAGARSRDICLALYDLLSILFLKQKNKFQHVVTVDY